MSGGRGRAGLVAAGLGALAILAILALQTWAIRGQSLTSDEPYHLLAGHQALRYGENTLNLEHPPLVKMVAALPLLLEAEPLAPRTDVTRWREASQVVFRDPALTRRLQHSSRAVLLAVFVLPWLWTCWLLGSRVGGARAGALLVAALGLSFAVLPYLPIVTTDAAVALGYGATLLAAGRYLGRPSAGSAALLGAGLGLALACKFSGVFAVAPVGLALALAPADDAAGGTRRSRRLGLGQDGFDTAKLAQGTPAAQGRTHDALSTGQLAPGALGVPLLVGRRLAHGALALAVAAVVVGSTYSLANRHYDSGRGREAIQHYAEHRATLLVEDELRPWEGRLLAVERASPGLSQWLTGLLGIRAQNAIGVYPSYAFGRIDRHGRWWYFPVLLLLKTPLALLVATVAAALAWMRRHAGPRSRERAGEELDPTAEPLRGRFLLLLAGTAVAYLGAAATSSYNLGYRHLLPVLPILFLPAVLWAARRPRAAAVLALLLGLEAAALGPLWIPATNTWWLGERNPARFALAGDNFDWKQGLVALAAEARRRGLGDLRVLDPLLSEAELAAYLPQARLVRPGAPVEPGWYAVAVLVEQYLPAILAASPEEVYGHSRYVAIARAWMPAWEAIRRRGKEQGLAAGTFRLYLVESAH